MKLRSLLLLALAATLGLCAVARAPKKRKTTVVENKLKPVPAAEFSYAIGVAQAPSLKNYIAQRGIDSTQYNHFIEGLSGRYTADDVKRMRAIVSGADIAEQNAKVIPAINKQATGKEDTTYVDGRLFVQGLIDGLSGAAKISADSASKVAEQQENYMNETRKAANAAFIANYKQEKGVKSTPSGLLYKVITQGTGALPTDTAQVEVHYEGKLIDGTVFDSSYKRGQTATFGVTQVIKGWTEALKLMPVGSTYELCIPYNLAYGEHGNRTIPPFATLIFKVELIAIK